MMNQLLTFDTMRLRPKTKMNALKQKSSWQKIQKACCAQQKTHCSHAEQTSMAMHLKVAEHVHWLDWTVKGNKALLERANLMRSLESKC